MILIRFALITFDKSQNIPLDFQFSYGEDSRFGVGNLIPTKKADTYIFLAGYKSKFRPKKTRERLIIFPRKIREKLEMGIEIFGNILAVSQHCSRKITSGNPILAIKPEDDDDIAFLRSATGFLVDSSYHMSTSGRYTFDPSKYISELVDRLDGVALMAEGLATDSATGKLREYIRFFERAFGVAGHQLIDPLSKFLCGTVFGYKVEEVKEWILLRDSATHADCRNEVALEIDCAWSIYRLEQAAYDVLLNKLVWRNPESIRRQLWYPINGTTSTNADMFLKKGFEISFNMAAFDIFRKFTAHLEGNFSLEGFDIWTGPMVTRASDLSEPRVIMRQGGKLHVVAEDDMEYFNHSIDEYYRRSV